VLVANVHGMSMSPTYHDGERLLAVRYGGLRRLRAGDVVIFRIPPGYAVPDAGADALLVKRVAALNVSPGEVFLLGDAPDHSLDSRTFGSLPQASILGIVVGRLPAR
jgi:phage repressor protein C with HTH and peptisase S24 domain